MKPVYFFGTRAKELAKRLHPVTNTRCLDLWTDGAEHYYLRTMRACGNRWRLHSFLLLPDWPSKLRTTMLRNLITWILFAFIGAHRD